MYLPDPFAVTDKADIDDLLRRVPFGALITDGPGGLYASHLPLLHDPAAGVLAGHLARANPHRDMGPNGEALVVFQGPHAYVSPSWYPGKSDHGRVVPTWNYEAVHVYGRLIWHDDRDWLLANVAALTDRFEAGQPTPWALADAPADFIERMLNGIVGVELRIVRIEAKRKLSQNRTAEDRQGVVSGLLARAADQDSAVAEAMRREGDDA